MQYFFDTYALIELLEGNPSYRRFGGVRFFTTRMNLYEMHYHIQRKKGLSEANRAFHGFVFYTKEFSDTIIREASIFRLRNKQFRFSFIDALGYVIAIRSGAKFLTGDNAFKGLPNVEFVR